MKTTQNKHHQNYILGNLIAKIRSGKYTCDEFLAAGLDAKRRKEISEEHYEWLRGYVAGWRAANFEAIYAADDVRDAARKRGFKVKEV
jgi:hypothetical protein